MPDDLELKVKLIVEQTGLSNDEVRKRIHKKVEELYGFVTLEGAAGMVAKELGVE